MDRSTPPHSKRHFSRARRGAGNNRLAGRIVERIIPAALVFQPVLDDVYELSTPAPKLIEESRDRRRLPPQAVTNLDWHNDMSKLILDINERIDAAVDERARAVIIRKLRRALDELN